MADEMGGPLLNLLKHKAVQKEIELTSDQKKKLSALYKELQDAFDPKKRLSLSEDEKLAQMKKMSDEMDAEIAKNEKRVEAILLPKQLERSKQIQLQMKLQTPSFALADPEVAKELGLTDDQKATIRSLNRSTLTILGEMRPGGGFPSAEEMKKMVKAHNERQSKATDILTAEQKEKLEKMKGPKFDLSALSSGPG